jgi:hypothetical protein
MQGPVVAHSGRCITKQQQQQQQQRQQVLVGRMKTLVCTIVFAELTCQVQGVQQWRTGIN